MMRRKLIAFTAAGIVLGLPSADASAQVFVDPSSPTAKEYAIPLEDARREASADGNETPVEQGDRSAPLFGEGVSEDDGSKANAGSGSGNRNGAGGTANGGDSPTTGTTSVEAARSVVATVPQGGFSDTLTIGAVALSVLLLGGVIGSIARRGGA